MPESFLSKWEKIIKDTDMHIEPEPIEGYVLPPDVTEIERAAATICGSNPIMALDDEAHRDFHGFVLEVLNGSVGQETEALRLLLKRIMQNLAGEVQPDGDVLITTRTIDGALFENAARAAGLIMIDRDARTDPQLARPIDNVGREPSGNPGSPGQYGHLSNDDLLLATAAARRAAHAAPKAIRGDIEPVISGMAWADRSKDWMNLANEVERRGLKQPPLNFGES